MNDERDQEGKRTLYGQAASARRSWWAGIKSRRCPPRGCGIRAENGEGNEKTMTDELERLQRAAEQATRFEQTMARIVAKIAPPNVAKVLAKMSAIEQMDWLRAHVAPPNLAPPPPPPDPATLARAAYHAAKRKEYKNFL